MISSVIIDDEKKSRDVLANILGKHCTEVNIIGMADSVKSGVELIRRELPALAFLDIEMADGTAFTLLEQVQDIRFDIIFTTAYDHYAIRAIKCSALDYLLKPLDVEEIKLAVSKITKKQTDLSQSESLRILLQNIKKADEQFNKIILPTGSAFEVVNILDIVRLEAEGNYTIFFLSGNRKILVSASLKHYEEILPAAQFIRVHHHHLINMNHVKRFLKGEGGHVVMTDDSKVEISRRKKDSFLQRLQRPQ